MKKIHLKRKSKEEKISTLEIIGRHVEHYRTLTLILTIFILIAALTFTIYWQFDPNSVSPLIDNLYLVVHVSFLAMAAAIIVLLYLNKVGKLNALQLSISLHINSFLIITFATLLAILDLKIGLSPITFLLACTLIGGLFIIEPIFFTTVTLGYLITIMVFQFVYHYPYFSNFNYLENIIYFVFYVLLVILVGYRHYHVTNSEYKAKRELEYFNSHDALTGLLNERSYLDEIEDISNQIKNKEVAPFGVLMMDVNNLKATNDAYGHRYGCHLVVRCGKNLPKVFTSSTLFHVGGDEFIAIIKGEDLDNFEKKLAKFDEDFLYKIVTFSGQELIFSVARGYSFYQKGDRYQDVLERADKEMYIHKDMLKKKYNFKKR